MTPDPIISAHDLVKGITREQAYPKKYKQEDEFVPTPRSSLHELREVWIVWGENINMRGDYTENLLEVSATRERAEWAADNLPERLPYDEVRIDCREVVAAPADQDEGGTDVD